ncbi:MAG: dTDP-4-dehydrorhamnose reductase [Candidatus Hydrogenedens sp.]|nr:dTDP-4-dehydrorhamnose reductase [Candidatus Hydrogenedens sp.]
MRTLIFGAKGQLGRDLMRALAADGEVLGCDLPETNIADEASAFSQVKEFSPDLIINAAAYTDVEKAEDNLGPAFLVNETGARNVADCGKRFGVPVVYYSTDFVFDGRKTTPYTPADATTPLSVYGRSKLAGEKATRDANPKHYILRTAWLYGPGGNNFVEKMIALAADRPQLKIVTDEVGSPTHTWDLCEATRAIVKTGKYGLYHAANAGETSRYDFARAIFELAGIDIDVQPCLGAAFPAKARRPAHAPLDCSALTAASGYTLRPWRDALEHYFQRRASAAPDQS